MNRRAFLALPLLSPLAALLSAADSQQEHHFQYEGIIGTSLDLVVWTEDSQAAEAACQMVLDEIDRLSSILSTRDPTSEISRLDTSNSGVPSRELKEVFAGYNYWERRTGGILSIRPGGPDTPRNVDALGKAYIVDRAAKVVKKMRPAIQGLLLNVGGDIVVWGRLCEIAIADPLASYDNAKPLTTIVLQDAAVATSGTYARGTHLIDGRNRKSAATSTAATVVASNAVSANALATTLCLSTAEEGFQFVEATPGAAALRVAPGALQRTQGFAVLERSRFTQTLPAANWPAGYHLTLSLPLKPGRSTKRPYVAVWVEDSSGKLVRVLAVWGKKDKYYPDLSTAWRFLQRESSQIRSVTRATRSAGKYELEWDGLDNERKPVQQGEYRITVETNQEHGIYAKQTGTINLGGSPADLTLRSTTNFDEVLIQYGPK